MLRIFKFIPKSLIKNKVGETRGKTRKMKYY